MKHYKFLIVSCMIAGCFLIILGGGRSVQAQNNSGSVGVEGSKKTSILDPENPEKIVDPGSEASTDGSLRIDYVSSLDFGECKITTNNGVRSFQALAQQFYRDTGARGSYIQITDQQADSSGWTLQVKQEYQFMNSVIQEAGEQELKGAVLSLDKGWANSSGTSGSPTVTRETIALNAIGSAYEIARAKTGEGKGVWLIAFGASDTNSNGQPSTLTPIVDKNGKAVVDSKYNKPVYANSAVTLSIPESSKIYPVEYQTKLTWIIAKLP